MSSITTPSTTPAPKQVPRPAPNSPLSITRLQVARRMETFGVPAMILGIVVVVSILISLIIQRAGADVTTPEFAEGARIGNQGVFWSLPGFLVYTGVQSTAATFPYALGLGATRRMFTLGTLASHVVISAFLAALCLAGLGIEIATGHWFTHTYAFDTMLLGAGDPGLLPLRVFLGALTSLSIGAAFGAVWVRFGPRGPAILAIVAVLALALTVLAITPQIPAIAQAFEVWWLIVAALVATAASAAGEYLALRRASVR